VTVSSNIIEVTIRGNDETSGAVKSAESGFSGLGKAGTAAMAGIGVAVAGLGVGIAAFGAKLSEAMDIEKGRDKLAAQLGLTAQQSEAFGRAAGELYSNAYGDSLEGVNEALRYVQQNIGEGIGDSEDALTSVTASVMDLSAAFGEDLGPMARAAGIMVKNGLAGDAQGALDILTVGLQNGANAGEDLLDTFTEYSPKFAELGIDATKAMGMVSQAMKAGARDSDFVADAIKEFAIKSKDASASSAEAFQAIGLNAKEMTAIFAKGGPEADAAMAMVMQRLRDMKDPVAQNAAAVGLFGTKAEDLGRSLYAIDPTTAVEGLGQVEGAAKRMGDTLNDNAATKIETFKRSMQQGLNDFMTNTVLPGFVSFAEGIGNALGPKLDTARQTWDTFTAAISGEDVVVPEWMQPIVDMVEKLRAKFEEFRPQLEDFTNNVLAKFAEWWPTIELAMRMLYDNALVPFMNFVGENSEALKNWAVMLGIIAAVIVGSVVLAFMALVGAIAAVVAASIGLVIAIQRIGQFLWDLFNNARDAMGGVIDKIEEVIQWFWDLAQNVGSAIADAVRWVVSLPGRISDAVGDLGGLLVNAGRSIIEGLVRGFNDKIQWAKDRIGDGLSSIRRLFPFSPAKEGPFSGSGYTDVSGAKLMTDFGQGAARAAATAAAAIAQAMRTVAAPFGLREAAAELGRHASAGGRVWEDMSFEGMSSQYADWLHAGGGMPNRQKLWGATDAWRGDYMDSAELGRDMGALQLSVGPGADGAVATMIMHLVRSGQIQINPGM
jgi:phage-related minor tail protein